MGQAKQPFDTLWKCSVTGTLLLALTGCQSLRTAGWNHKRAPVNTDGTAVEVASTPTRRHISLKPRWGLPWRSKSEPVATTPTSETVVTHKPSSAVHPDLSDAQMNSSVRPEVATTAKKRPRFRLRSPIEFIHDDQASTTKPAPAVPSLSIVPQQQEVPLLEQAPATTEATAPTGDAVEAESLSRMQERMNNIFLVSATLPGDSVPGEVNLDPITSIPSNSVDVQVEEEAAPIVESETTTSAMPPISEVMETSIDQKPIIMEPLAAGVGPDARGFFDNSISRLGASYYNSDLTGPQWGFLSTGETTHQIHNSSWFMHGGVAGVAYDGHTPIGYSIGISHLARLVGNKVDNPWVLALAYDGYYDNHFMGITNDGAYVDQMRGMLGYAICPRWDVGVWAGGGLSQATVALPVNPFGPAGNYNINSGTRVAGYTAWNFFQTGIFNITSVGWQNNQTGNFFMQSDAYIPLTGAVNAFVGGGYGNNFGGSTNLNFGLEFTWGRTCVARYIARHCKGRELPKVGMMASDTMPRGSFCRVIDPCCVRYRGGWANDTYRSAFRVNTPAQFASQIDMKRIPNPVPPGGIQGGPVIVPDPGTSGGTTDCPPLTNPLETRPIRVEGRPTRTSNLSQYLTQTGQKPDTLNK